MAKVHLIHTCQPVATDSFDWFGLAKEVTELHVEFAGERTVSDTRVNDSPTVDLSGNSSSASQKYRVERKEATPQCLRSVAP